MTTAAAPRADRARVMRQGWIDIAVLSALSVLGMLGFETSFGGLGFLVAGVGGLVVGVGIAVLTYRFRIGLALTAIAAVIVYFLLGTPIALPSQGVAIVLPTLQSLSELFTGAVYGWKDVLTLTTPIGAPAYISAVPYLAGWLVGVVFSTLSLRWLPSSPRSSVRYAVALAGPIALYVIGVLIGTEQPFLAGVRGISFAVITLVWLGWRRTPNQSASASANRALLQRKLVGTLAVVAIAAVITAGIGAVVPPSSYARFVLREKITPPFDPSDYPSPLAGFRYFKKSVATDAMFTATGLKSGDRIRLASMDEYTGLLWNVVGTDVDDTGSGSFDLVGSNLPTSETIANSSVRNVTITVDKYRGVWVPVVGVPQKLVVGGAPPGAEVQYNSSTATAALTGTPNLVSKGLTFTIATRVSAAPTVAQQKKIIKAQVQSPAPYPVADASTQALAHQGNGSPYARLMALRDYLYNKGRLNDGTTDSGSPPGHGANRMTLMLKKGGVLVGDAEQFASAFALEADALGYPTRVVMGFKPTVASGQKSVTVYGKDVTAWDEVDFAGIGWVTFDPTPIKAGSPNTPPPPATQPSTKSRQPPRTLPDQNDILSPVAIGKQKPKPTGFTIPAWVYTTTGIVAAPFIIYFLPLLVIAWVKRRRRTKRRTSGRGDEQVAGAWDELTDSYAELGFRIPRGVTRLNAARQVQRQLKADDDEALPSLVGFAATTDQAVFSGEDIPAATVDDAWSLAKDEISRARQSVPRWRRWLSRFRVRSKRGLPVALTSIDTTAVTDRVKELVNR
jgi:transglutaminase-like putative cysteine protease